MAKYRSKKDKAKLKNKVLRIAARLFLEQGYTNTTIKELADASGVSLGSMTNLMGQKEEILKVLVEYVLEEQFAATEKFLGGRTDDLVLFYAAETTLQLYMAESSEHIRDIYANAYSLPKSSALIQENITMKLQRIFADYLPGFTPQDFYKLEIASGGIMRGFMTIPCSLWFTIDAKVDAFLDATFRVYRVPEEKIQEAKQFVKQFDYPVLVQRIVQGMYDKLAAIEAADEVE